MKAFFIDEETIWAANSLEEAIADYINETGEQPIDPSECSAEFLDELIPEYDEDERPTGNMTTLRAYLNEMDAPGFLAGEF